MLNALCEAPTAETSGSGSRKACVARLPYELVALLFLHLTLNGRGTFCRGTWAALTLPLRRISGMACVLLSSYRATVSSNRTQNKEHQSLLSVVRAMPIRELHAFERSPSLTTKCG